MKIVVSCGDCNGIGLEAFFKAIPLFYNEEENSKCQFILVVNKKTLKEYIGKIEFDIKINEDSIEVSNHKIEIKNIESYSPVRLGVMAPDSGTLAIESLDTAVDMVFKKDADAILTLPISKDVMSMAGWGFIGHTQYLARQCSLAQPLMILFKDELRVAVVTDHIPLMSVGEYLRMADLPLKTAEIFNDSLKKDFAIKAPKIAVLSLNPHAGENGNIGKEEVDMINWQIKLMQSKHILAEGPKAADGFFGFGEYTLYDGILAMYHDQGLIPMKLLSKGSGVNYTAGLPIVRTSPDHGTAFSIAGKNRATPDSTLDAMIWGRKIVENRGR